MSGLRRATVADAPVLALIEVRAWHHALADIIFPEDTPTVPERTIAWESLLAGEGTALVADVAGAVRGFVAFGRATADEHEDVPDAPLGQILTLSVDPTAQGAGLGRAMLDGAEAGLRGDGVAVAFLWTPQAAPAREILGRHGWVQDREVVPVHGVLAVPEVRYRKRLDV